MGYRECPHVIGYRRQGVLVPVLFSSFFSSFPVGGVPYGTPAEFTVLVQSSSAGMLSHFQPPKVQQNFTPGRIDSRPTGAVPDNANQPQPNSPNTTTTTPKLKSFCKSIWLMIIAPSKFYHLGCQIDKAQANWIKSLWGHYTQ